MIPILSYSNGKPATILHACKKHGRMSMLRSKMLMEYECVWTVWMGTAWIRVVLAPCLSITVQNSSRTIYQWPSCVACNRGKIRIVNYFDFILVRRWVYFIGEFMRFNQKYYASYCSFCHHDGFERWMLISYLVNSVFWYRRFIKSVCRFTYISDAHCLPSIKSPEMPHFFAYRLASSFQPRENFCWLSSDKQVA